MSYLLFIIFLIIAILFAKKADKYEKKRYIYVSIIILSLIAGLRGKNVGIDTQYYYDAFVNDFPKSWQFTEEGFRSITRILLSIFENPNIIMIIYAFITNFLILIRLWDFRKKCNYTNMIILYICIYFLSTMNIMRQFISIAILFYASRFLEKKKYFSFSIVVILVSTIHKASLLALLITFIYIWDGLTSRKKVLLFIPIVLIIAVVCVNVINIEMNHITNYFNMDNSLKNLNIPYLYRIFAFFASIYLSGIYKTFKRKKDYKENQELISCEDSSEFSAITKIYFFGLLFASMGMFYTNMTRIGLFYLIYELLYWGYLTKNYNNSKMNWKIILVYALYVFGIEFIKNGQGIFPYYLNM